MKITKGINVKMPEPNDTDSWNFGGFWACVEYIKPNGNLIVEDADGDFFEVEGYRVTLAE